MQNSLEDTSWKKDGDWKKRYSILYSSLVTKRPQDNNESRISFMGNDFISQTSWWNKPDIVDSILSPQSTSIGRLSSCYNYPGSVGSRNQSVDLGGHETLLLDMVRAKHREIEEEGQDQARDLPKEEDNQFNSSNEACMHGLSLRLADRSVSRSRVSRISTRRDMDIPSILAYSASFTQPVHLEIPAFRNLCPAPREELPRWSIRKSVCPVCSEKWKDRSFIKKVRSSGLKRNSSMDLPTVIAPARLRTSIAIGYVPKPAQAVIDEDLGVFRNTSAAWQLTRARKLRLPKVQLPPEATAPPLATASVAQKDLHSRVIKFITDGNVNKSL